ncbi:hypothetical protein C8A00DRAFT_17363 [Chaetomidium leptoderma]|uniref:AT hook domain-containing protein n=1 Tax=Chaetomidium leptoderma TaxID=669021 RepID=A0AAN6VH59_9PEZI|nr:hypothetical protein C8A00DRAFT_17363 [Chaetomidium leptoderma]
MAPRREILDSEDDDGSDFGDAAAPRDDPHEFETIGASHSAGTDSTDPSFFQRIYDQQKAAADGQDVIPDTAPSGPAASAWTDISSAPPPGQKPQAKDYSSLTSITDPSPASRRPKRTRDIPQAEVIDLTDITTPRKEAASRSSDVWDMPTSARSQRNTRTYGKPKPAQLSLEQEAPLDTMPDTQDPYAFPESTPPTRKTKRGVPPSSSAQQAQDSSPVMLVPTEEAASSDRRTRSSRKKKAGFGGVESSLPDTAVPSLYVTQSTLTASQRQEYRVVSLSSEAMPEGPETLLAAGQSGLGGGELYRSSGATTIAYPTPSRAGLSRLLPESVEELDEGGGVAATSLGHGVEYQQSSPDVLTDMTTTTASRSKRSRIKIVSSAGLASSELEPPSSTRRAKKRRVVREVETNPREPDPLGGAQDDNDAPQQYLHDDTRDASHAKVGVNSETSVPEAEPIDVELIEAPTETPKPPAKGKRGRKKKGSKAEDAEPTPPVEAEPEPTSEVTEPPPTQRKRGRPRKAETAKPQLEPVDEPELQATEVEPDAAPQQPLCEVPDNSRPNSAAGPGRDDSTVVGRDSKENELPVAADKGKAKEKETEKQAVKEVKSGVQKVQYRVGLSKRSRIAPLLKSLKKPV